MKYDKYKSSGSEWIGNIPNHWGVKRIKDFGLVLNGYAFNSYDFINIGVRVMKITNIQTMRIDFTDESFVDEKFYKELKQFRVQKGDVVFALTRPIISTGIKAAIVDIDDRILLNQRNAVFKPKNIVNTRWFYFLILSSDFIQRFDGYIDKTGTQPNISASKIGWIECSFPTIEEQTEIAEYLDSKTQAIDKKIKLLAKKADYYKELRKSIINDAVCKGLNSNIKLKESELGVQIASHFEIKRLKDICKIINGYAFKSNEYLDFGLPVVRIGDINYDINFEKVAFVSEEHKILAKESKIKMGDILMAMTGATIGKNSFYNTDKEAYLNQRVCSFRVNKNIETKFLGHFISSMFFQDFVQLICGGSAQENISKAQLEIFKIIVPPKEEQIAISNYLDEKTKKIDAIVTNIGKQIETLKELRKTLINDVVTGKIKVTNN